MKKRAIIFFTLIILINLSFISALGIGPGKQTVDYEPGLELTYSFKVYADEGQEVEIYATGEFADLVKFDKKSLIGNGHFTITIKLPDKIEKPGDHNILIGVKEKIIKGGTAVGTAVDIRTPIAVKVPYPGKYAEISLITNNANVGIPIEFKVKVASMGQEPILAKTSIDIYSAEEKIQTLDLGNRVIANQEEETFIGILETTTYKPGPYRAIANVDYQEGKAKEEKGFKIGHLFVEIGNYTKEMVKEGIKPFKIEVQSAWNDPIENVHGEVYILKNNKNITNFLTPSTNLKPWEKKTLQGYIDTGVLSLGTYDLKIKLNYKGNSTIAEGKLKVKEKSSYTLYLVTASILVLITLFIIFKNRILKKKNDKKGK